MADEKQPEQAAYETTRSDVDSLDRTSFPLWWNCTMNTQDDCWLLMRDDVVVVVRERLRAVVTCIRRSEATNLYY